MISALRWRAGQSRSWIRWATYLLVSMCLVVDSLNGFLIREKSLSISPIYKGGLMVLLLAQIHRRSTCVVLLLAIASTSILMLYADGDIGMRIDWVTKFAFIVLIVDFYSRDARRGDVSGIVMVCTVSLAVIVANFLAGLMGYGYAQYFSDSQQIGTRGFFYAGNEVSAAIVCATGVLLTALSAKRDAKLAYFAVAAVALAACAMSTMKTPAISVLLLALLLPLMQAEVSFRRITIPKVLLPAVLGVPTLAFILVFYLVQYTDLPERIEYFYRESGLVTLLFSQRDRWAMEALDVMTQYRPYELLFGGSAWTREMGRIDIVEIDPIDALMSFGIVGLAVMYFPYLASLFRGRTSEYARQSRLVVALIIAISCTAGHVLFSGLAAPLLAGALALTDYRGKSVSIRVSSPSR